jgi:hypothetical protein
MPNNQLLNEIVRIKNEGSYQDMVNFFDKLIKDECIKLIDIARAISDAAEFRLGELKKGLNTSHIFWW